MLDLTPATTRTAHIVDHVRDDQLDAPTPSHDSVRQVVHHVLGLCVAFRDAAAKLDGLTTNTPPAHVTGPLPERWREQARTRLSELAEAWREPSAWEGMTTAGAVTFPASACGLVALDEVLLHGWDLAAATGQDYRPSDEEAEAVLAIVTPSEDPDRAAAEREGMFGPAVPVPGGATAFERVLALSGRDPSWTA